MKQNILIVHRKMPAALSIAALILSFAVVPTTNACVNAKDCPVCTGAYGNLDGGTVCYASLSVCQSSDATRCKSKQRACAMGNGKSHSHSGCACVIPGLINGCP